MTEAAAPTPPELKTMRIEVDGEIGTLTLDRPKVLNAMSPELIGELVTAAAWLADRAQLRALIVTGAGRAFSAGGDVTWFSAASRSRASGFPRTCAAGRTCCTRRSLTSAGSRIP